MFSFKKPVSSNPTPKRNFITHALRTLAGQSSRINRQEFNRLSELLRLEQQLQYPRYVTYLDFEYLFERNPIANRICSIFPRYCWNPRPLVLEIDNQTGIPQTPFELACAEIAAKVDLFQYLERADIAAQIGQYGALYISFNDQSEPAPAKLKQKVSPKNPITDETYMNPPQYGEGLDQVNWESIQGKGAAAINYVVPYKQPNAWPTQYLTDYAQPSFSLIDYYNLQSGGDVFGSAQSANIVYGASLPVTWNVVHSSRVIHIVDNNIGNNILGVPKLQPVFNDLLNLERVTGGSAITYQYNARGGVVFNVDQKDNQSLDANDIATFQSQVNDYLQGYGRVLTLDGVSAKELDFKVYSPDKHAEVYFQNIAAGSGIPTRILVGNEQGRLASDQDKILFDSLVKTRQEGYCAKLIKLFFDPLIAHGVIPAPQSGAYKAHFPTLSLSDDKDNAALFNQVALGLAALGNSKSTEMDNEMNAFIVKAKEILKIKGEEIELPTVPASYLRPDVSSEDRAALFNGKGLEDV